MDQWKTLLRSQRQALTKKELKGKMYLPVLDQSPKNSAEYTADVHLNNMIVFCASLLNNAIHVLHSDKIVEGKDLNGVRFYALEGIPALSIPTPINSVMFEWVKWVKESKTRIWWIITLAFFLNKERMARYPDLPNHESYIRIAQLQKAGVTKYFDEGGPKAENFPFALPHELFPKFVYPAGHSTIDAYRESYRLLVGKQRMKWKSPRAAPSFMGGTYKALAESQQLMLPVVKLACDLCGSDADPRMCDITTCPGKKAYNL